MTHKAKELLGHAQREIFKFIDEHDGKFKGSSFILLGSMCLAHNELSEFIEKIEKHKTEEGHPTEDGTFARRRMM